MLYGHIRHPSTMRHAHRPPSLRHRRRTKQAGYFDFRAPPSPVQSALPEACCQPASAKDPLHALLHYPALSTVTAFGSCDIPPRRCVLQSAPHPVPTSTDLAWCPTSWGSVQRLFSCCRGCRALLACSSAPWAVPRFARLGRPWPPPSIDTWRSFPSPLQPNAHAKARIRNSGVERAM